MKLIEFQIQGGRKIKAAQIEINPKGITEIKGENRQGKTTVIDTLGILLFGKDRFHKAMVNKEVGKLKLLGKTDDGYTIKRSFTEKSNTLTVTKEMDGGEFSVKSPQEFLNNLISYIAIEPMKFIMSSAQDKKKLLLKESGIDFTDIDATIKEKEELRRGISRDIKELGSPVLPILPENGKRIDIANTNRLKNEAIAKNHLLKSEYDEQVQAQQEKIKEINNIIYDCDQLTNDVIVSEIVKDQLRLKEIRTDLKDDDIRIPYYDVIIKNLENQIKYTEAFLQSVTTFEEPLDVVGHGISEPNYLDISKFDKTIENADAYNKQFDTYDELKAILEKKVKKEKEYGDYTISIEKFREEKKAKLKAADLGVQDLMVEDDGIYVDGVFSEDWSGMEGLKYAIMFGLKRSKLRCVAIDSFDAFDPKSKKEFLNWSLENDIQAIVTTASEIPDHMEPEIWYIEDGVILNHPQKTNEELNKQSEEKQAKAIKHAKKIRDNMPEEERKKFEEAGKKREKEIFESPIEGEQTSSPSDFSTDDDDDF